MALSEDALYASYRRLERPLFNVLYRMLWQVEDCQDLIHDAYVRIWTKRATVDAATLDRLVWVSAMNLARNRLRWRRLWRQVPLEEAPVLADGMSEDVLATRRLRQALAQLPATARQVLLLAEFSGMSGADIAAVLGIPPGTVASRKHHAMRRLKDLLGEAEHA